MPQQPESRVKKTLLNARVNLIFYFLTLILSFFSRKIFINNLGVDFIGLAGTLQNLLGFLNLAELGVGSAIGYLLYKPLYDHDKEKIIEIVSVMGYLYRWIGFIILCAGLVLSCFLPLIFPNRDATLTLPIIYCTYFAFLASSLIGYFINYRQNLLGADQRNYVVTAYFQTSNIIKMLIQMSVAYRTHNLFLWVAIEFSFGILYSVILNWKINQTYPWLRANVKFGRQLFKKYPEVMKKTRQVFAHRIGCFFQYQSMPFLIYTFCSFTTVAYYQNYIVVTSRVGGLFSNLLTGMGASVGNLVAEGNKSKIINVFWELQSLRFFTGGLIVVPIYLLINSFIMVWLGSEYLLSTYTLILILIPILINNIRGVVDDFNFAYGLFWDVWSPVAECTILLAASISMGYFLGLNGVLCGPATSLLIVIVFWKPYLLFHWGFKKNIGIYWMMYLKNLCCIFIPGFITHLIFNKIQQNQITNFFDWFLYALQLFLTYSVLSYLAFLTCTSGMKNLNHRIVELTKRLVKRYNGN